MGRSGTQIGAETPRQGPALPDETMIEEWDRLHPDEMAAARSALHTTDREAGGLLSALDNARVVIWFCPANHRHCVEWTTDENGMTPHCLEPGCGQVGGAR
jgi:hypothetical protein